MKRQALILVLLLLIALPLSAQEDAVNPSELELSGTPSEICEAATPAIEPESRSYSGAENVLEAGVDYRAVICTSAGAVYIDLYESFTPLTVNNFVFLAEQNYYNNIIFHRVMEDFMAQGGDPTGTGTGGPGYQFADEIIGFLGFDRPGLLAMANSGPATNGSQFFITTSETPWLDGVHTIFGEVLEGQAETVDNILLRDPAAGGDATRLDAVVIIRDPQLVDSTFEETLEPATVETFIEGLNLLSEDALPPDLIFSGANARTTEEAVAVAPEDLQADYLTFLNDYGHEYQVNATIENTDCNAEYFFAAMSYMVVALDSVESATMALEDDFLPGFYEAIGYTSVDTGDTNFHAYSAPSQRCGEGEVAVTIDIQRGRYVANVSVVYSASIVSQIDEAGLAQITASDIAGIFESMLGDAYRSELR